MPSALRRLAAAPLLVAAIGLCCTVRAAAGHRQQTVVSSAFIRKDAQYSGGRFAERGCSARSPAALLAQPATSTALDVRGGSSSYGAGGGGDYDDDYYYRENDGGGNGDGRGYGGNDGYGYDDRDSRGASYGSSPSYSSGGGRDDRYYEDDYGRRGSGYYDDEGRYHEDYDDRGGQRSRRGASKPKLPTALTAGNRKLGVICLSAGAGFTMLGITLFFNKTLMRLGNLLFVAGVPLMIGPGRTVGYFLQPKKARATGCLAAGILLVLVGHPVIGILLEIFGLLNLFGNMFPLVRMMAKNLPVVGGLFGGSNGNGGGGGGGKRRESRYDDDRYYEDERYEREYRDERY